MKTAKKKKIKEVLKKGGAPLNKRYIVIAFIIGLSLGLIIMFLFTPERIAKLENGEEVIVTINGKNITANELYNDMKEEYPISILIDKIDNTILTELYPEDNELKKEVNEMADQYISMYESYYGYTEEKFLEINNFKNKKEFLEALKLEYRRNKYFNDTLSNTISNEEIEKYYNEKVYGDIETKYIAIEGINEDNLALMNRVINRLNKNESYESILEHYKDRVEHQELGFVSYKGSLSDVYMNTLKNLKDGEYTKEPVKDGNKYYVIFKISTKEKASLESLRDEIKKDLIQEKKNSDQQLYYETLIDMRKKYNVSFKDTVLAKKYEKELQSYEIKND